LDAASGDTSARSQRLRAGASGVRYVKFDFLSNQRGLTFPATDGSQDNAFVGLSEVRFLERVADSGAIRQITGVKIHQASSALGGTHDRKAEHLIDGSGLRRAGLGWDRQGCPFYAEGVSYRQAFNVPQPTGRYTVSLPSWHGSVARVIVNGALAGQITCPPWECDVSKSITPGRNAVEVVVVGTLKNTLGPHHVGALRGAAWPHMFQQGPETGPPPGTRYDTIGYGLFEPFVLTAGGR
jgi:hypothetical protein